MPENNPTGRKSRFRNWFDANQDKPIITENGCLVMGIMIIAAFVVRFVAF